ncbi:IF4G1 factor, partial [Catharus fuscescens]|nr:IF4G1 factor [Catharus fuscescens]
MNKAPQPTGGAPTAPHPAPSPGLPQPTFPPGQTAPVVFNPAQTSQMNTPSQPRQGGFRSLQHFYQNRAQPPASASRVQSNTTARPGPPAHVYPAASQVMMIPSQISYTPSQGAYYIPGQGRSTYVVPTQQYPVQPGAPSFYPGASPTEFGTYAGAYYPAQGVQQFSAGVPTAQVIVSQQPPIPPKRERKTIRIRDPNQGGKDITEEIMSGARTSSTPTPPQAGSSLEPQANGETPHVAVIVRPGKCPCQGWVCQLAWLQQDDRPKPALVVSKPVSLEPNKSASPSPPPPLIPEAEPVVLSPVTLLPLVPVPNMDMVAAEEEEEEEEEVAIPLPEPTLQEPVPPEVPPVSIVPSMPAVPLVPAAPSPPPTVPQAPEAPAKPASPSPPPLREEPCPEPTAEANGVLEETPETVPEAPVCQPVPVSEPVPVPTPDSPIAQPEELPLPNGVEGTSKVEPNEEQPESDVSPISEPEEPAQPGTPASPPAEEEEEESEGPARVYVLVCMGAREGSVYGNRGLYGSVLLVSGSWGLEVLLSFTFLLLLVAMSVPKKKRRMKELNKKEAVGDLLDAFKEIGDSASEAENKPPTSAPASEAEDVAPARPQEESEETWEEKEDKLAPEKGKAAGQKYGYKEEQWKPLNPEEKKRYDREFLLGFQFIFASMQKPEGLPQITDVVLDKPNKTPLRPIDPMRIPGMNCSPDFTPSFANLGRPVMGNRGLSRELSFFSIRQPSGLSSRRSQQNPRKEPRKIIATVSLNEDVKLNKAEKAWKPSSKRASEEEDPENIKTQELLRRVRSILNKLTPQMFQQLMKQVMELSIDTEERLKGVIDLVFEKAISEPNFSVAYANMCRCLMGLKVPTTDKPTVTVNFRKLLLNRCQKEFEKDKDDDEIFEKRQKEMDDASAPEEKARMKDELEEARDKARRRSLGNIKFIGELFKLKMLTEAIMHDCVVKLLKNHDEESLECLCRLLTTIGKDLDFEKAKPRMDQYFNQMEKIIKEKKTSSRIRFMLQDVIDLRRNSWVPRRGDQGPKTIDQIHKEAEMEEHREHIKVQQLMSKDKRRGPPGPSSGGRSSLVADDGWNTVPISKGNRPIDTSRLTKITKPGSIDSNNQLFAPGGRLSWGKGSSGGSGAKPSDSASDSGRPATSTLNRFSALQQSMPAESPESRRVVQRSSSSRDRSEKAGDKGDREPRLEKGSDRLERPDRGERVDRNRSALTKRSFSKETEDRSREREKQGGPEAVRKAASMTEERDRSRETIKQEPTPPATSTKPTLSEEELEKKSKAIIEEYLHINDMKEALQCVQELGSPSSLYIFVQNGIESTLERSTISREHMGALLCQLVKAGTLSKEQYYKGLREILEIAEDMEIDIPHIWLYLAELITPILQEEGIPMEELFREITKPLVPIGKATTLLVEVLGLLCKGMGQKTAGKLWRDGGLSWKEFLPEDQDVNKFVTEQKLEYTMGDSSDMPSRKELTSEELCKQMDKLLKENPNNQRIYDWIEANLSEQQVSSNTFIRALMTSVCHLAIVFENPYRVDATVIRNQAKLLQKYLRDEQKELQALYALQALVVKLDQP